MTIHAVGLDHPSCPLSVRERVSIGVDDAAASAFDRVHSQRPAGFVVLSTCNRLEVYAQFESRAGNVRCSEAYRTLIRYIATRAGLSEAVFQPYLKRYAGRGAVEHLARVASGLESAIVGEPEILGQVKEALKQAVRRGSTSDILEAAFRTALRSGRRARAETGIGHGSASLATAIADRCRQHHSDGRPPRVVLVGFGTIGRKVFRVLQKRGTEVVVVNRSVPLANDPGGLVVHDLEALSSLLVDADAAIFATSAGDSLLDREAVGELMTARGNRPIVVVDAAVPRNVHPEVGDFPEVNLVNLDAIAGRMEGVIAERRKAVPEVESIIEEELRSFERWRKVERSAEVIAELRRKADRIRQEEVRRALDRLPSNLPPEARQALEQVSSAIVRKLLHDPTLTLRNSDDDVRAERSRAVEELFALTRPGVDPRGSSDRPASGKPSSEF